VSGAILRQKQDKVLWSGRVTVKLSAKVNLPPAECKGGITMAVKRRDVKRSGLDAKIFECFYDGGEVT